MKLSIVTENSYDFSQMWQALVLLSKYAFGSEKSKCNRKFSLSNFNWNLQKLNILMKKFNEHYTVCLPFLEASVRFLHNRIKFYLKEAFLFSCIPMCFHMIFSILKMNEVIFFAISVCIKNQSKFE